MPVLIDLSASVERNGCRRRRRRPVRLSLVHDSRMHAVTIQTLIKVTISSVEFMQTFLFLVLSPHVRDNRKGSLSRRRTKKSLSPSLRTSARDDEVRSLF